MFRGEWALVTGAGSGIGRAFAEKLAEEGARLILVDWNADSLETVRRELGERGAHVIARRVDVSSRVEVEALGAWTRENDARPFVIVNAAGVLEMGGALDTSWESWERVVRVNFWGVLHGAKTFVPDMRRAGRGVVVNVASASGVVGFASIGAYSTSKFAVVGLSTSLHAELASEGVRVVAVCPGLVRTNLALQPSFTEATKRRLHGLLERRGIEPRAVAEAGLRGARRGRALVHVGRDAHFLAWLARLVPNAAARILARLTRSSSGD